MARENAGSLALAILLVGQLPVHSEDLITCGWDIVRALRISGTNAATLWTWSATNSNLPDWCKPLFATTDECKPCPNGQVLITSSGGPSLNGAVALADPMTSNVLFYAHAANAHSADLLPGNRLAVALSYQTNGNRLVIFNLSQSDVELFSVALWGAHGVVWDEQRQVLWALADSFIREYQLQTWDINPQLLEVMTIPLPDGSGHDLYPVPNSPAMTVATALHCWLFDRDKQTFMKHPLLGDTGSVKSISVDPATGEIVYVQADTQWWSEWLYFLAPAGALDFPGEHFYKARWIPLTSPPLSISLTSTNTVVVCWPATATGFSLQQNTNLDTTNWDTPAEPIAQDGTNKFIVVDPPMGQRFYRLLKASP